jgi:exopolyphosphatase/guanosine-5'-triphosphate,3'-diphosphate pyrophosphatase
MSLRASIDLGTNTCLLLIADWDQQKKAVIRAELDRISFVRLGQGVDQNRSLHPEAMDRARKCLVEYSAEVKKRGLHPADAVCVATSQARDAQNGAAFFKEIQATTGFHFRTLSGDEEAQYTFLGGLLPGMDPSSSVVIDIGGGSTELMGKGGGKSLDIGSVRFTERFFRNDPVTDDEFWTCQDAIDSELMPMQAWRETLPPESNLVGVAGTVTTVAAWNEGLEKFDARRLDGVELTRGDVHRFVEELKWRTSAERRELGGMEPQRADVILAGAMILWRTMELLAFPRLTVSTRGLRYGVLRLP